VRNPPAKPRLYIGGLETGSYDSANSLTINNIRCMVNRGESDSSDLGAVIVANQQKRF
jgi:hypothetical protein